MLSAKLASLLHRILSAAIEVAHAESGCIVLVNGSTHIPVARNRLGEEIHCDLLQSLGEQAAVALEKAELREASQGAPLSSSIIGSSSLMQKILGLIERFAPLPYPVLLLGESGTGKELVAKALHQQSARSKGAFLAANVAAIPAGLFESEMFGHVRGAFTGAESSREGLFQQAEGGTLFLDEINSLPEGLQEKLLRVLQEREIRRVGETKSIPTNVRLIAAANEDLERSGFRSDLYHRLNVLRIDLPPLRSRFEDLPALTSHLLQRIAHETGRQHRLSLAAIARLREHSWPGNVRELENALRRASALSDHFILEPIDFAFLSTQSTTPISELRSINEYLRQAIHVYGHQMTARELAERLGISRKTLWAMKQRFGL